MNATQAVRRIQKLVAAGKYVVRRHFQERMDQRGLFWVEVMDIVDAPLSVRDGGEDQHGRERWFLTGLTAAGKAEVFIVLETDVAIFWTLYWRKS